MPCDRGPLAVDAMEARGRVGVPPHDPACAYRPAGGSRLSALRCNERLQLLARVLGANACLCSRPAMPAITFLVWVERMPRPGMDRYSRFLRSAWIAASLTVAGIAAYYWKL